MRDSSLLFLLLALVTQDILFFCVSQVDDMINELKFSNYVATGKYVKEIDLGEFIKCKYFELC